MENNIKKLDSTQFRDKLVKIALPRLLLNLFDTGVDFQLFKAYRQHMLHLDQLDDILKVDPESEENHTTDEEIRTCVQTIISNCTRLEELIDLAKKDLMELKQEYINAME